MIYTCKFSGGLTGAEIVNWLLKKTGHSAKAIASVVEAKEFVSSDDVVVLGLFKVTCHLNLNF